MSTELTADDRALLDRPLHGFLTVAPVPGGRPRPRPVWYEVTDDGRVQVFTGPTSPRVRRIEADPWASLVVAPPPGETERWVELTGPATLHADGAAELLDRLAPRYWDLDDPGRVAELEEMRAMQWTRIVITPDSVRRFTA